jgi:hypothetical protein
MGNSIETSHSIKSAKKQFLRILESKLINFFIKNRHNTTINEITKYFINCCVVTIFNKEIYLVNTRGCIH